MFVHGIVLACLFAPMHECSHGTAFRTRWLNEFAYRLVSLVYISQPTWYRYRHAVHHTYTQIQGKTRPCVLPSPNDLEALCRTGRRLALLDDISRGHHQARAGNDAAAGLLVRSEGRFAAHS